MNLHQPFDPIAPAATSPDTAAAPMEAADPRECDAIVKEMVMELGRDDSYVRAASWARTFLLHAFVVAICFAAWAAYSA